MYLVILILRHLVLAQQVTPNIYFIQNNVKLLNY